MRSFFPDTIPLDAELASAMFQKFLDKRQEAAVYIVSTTVLWDILAVVNYWPISPPGSKGRKLKTPKYDQKSTPIVGDIYIF